MKEKVFLRCLKIYVNNVSGRKITKHDISDCFGVVGTENKETLGQHISSSPTWLRIDLKSKFDNEKYEVVDMIDEDVEDMLKEQ